MSQTFQGAINVAATGVSQATSGTSAGAGIPVAQSGEIPRYIRVGATVSACFRMGVGAQTAVATDLLLQPSESVILSVPRGVTHFAVIQLAAAGVVIVTPLENC